MKKGLFIAVTAIIFFAIAFCSVELIKEYKKSKAHEQEMKTNREFAAWCLDKFPAKNISEQIINLRHCVAISSHFSISKEHVPVWADHAGTAQWMLDYARGDRADSPPMECAYRSYSLRGVYRAMGWQAKDLVVVKNNENYDDHVVVEVLNPETNAWQYEDPSYDVQYRHKIEKHVLSADDLLTLDQEFIVACDHQGRCGWDYKTHEGRNVNASNAYWNAIYSKHDKLLRIAKARFDELEPRVINGKTQSYCELRKKWCGNITYID